MVDHEDWALSYLELDRRSDVIAAALVATGIRPGDVVALRLPSDERYLVAMAAIAKVGAATAGVNPGLSPAEQDAVVERSTARTVLDADALAEFADSPHAAPHGVPPAPLPDDPERLAAVVFTSGSTGTPKGAMFRNRHLDAATRIDLGVGADGWGGGGPMMASTPFPHIGFMLKVATYLRTGVTIHTLARWRADDVWRLVERAGLSTIGGVAPQIALLLRSAECDRVDRSALTMVIAGGAASPPALVEETMERLGVTYSTRYSSTESGGVGLSVDWHPGETVVDAIGTPRPGVRAELRNTDGRSKVKVGEVGELWISSPAVFDGYLGDPDATAAVLVDGWWRSGDLGVVEDGRVRLAGRSKEMYVRGGYNVYPGEVEAVLRDHPDVLDVGVTPRTDPVMGEIGVAIVVSQPAATPPSLDGLRTFAEHRLARWKLPEAIIVVDALPLTSMHKVDRGALAALAVTASTS